MPQQRAPQYSLFDLQPVFQAAGQEWNVDPLLLQAVAAQETGGTFRTDLTSPAGAQGLMQIMPGTQKTLGVERPFDPTESIWGAAKLIDQALTAENGNVENALLYYHGGEGWRNAYGKESAAYVPGVAKYYRMLQQVPQQQAGDGSQQPPQPNPYAKPGSPTSVARPAPPSAGSIPLPRGY